MKYADPEDNNHFFEQKYQQQDLTITLNHQGNKKYTKVSYPVKYGCFSRLETRKFIFEFNLNHEIRHARSKHSAWIHPSEWLKRTMGNDWIYYSTGGYSGVFEAIGEYYLPNLMYPTNSLLGGKPFKTEPIKTIIEGWNKTLETIPTRDLPEPFARWIKSVKQINPDDLHQKARQLFKINGSRVTVMPPDARHVDYNIIPLTISDGCLYKCKFCKIKNKKPFLPRSRENISNQIRQLKMLYAEDIINYNALFLGEHDALNTPDQLILDSLDEAIKAFGFCQGYMEETFLFMFASADALLNTDFDFFRRLDQTGVKSFINVGIESFDQATLDMIGKPLTAEKVIKAFNLARRINTRFHNVEISCNFIMDDALPASHSSSLKTHLRDTVPHVQPKGSIYLSPLKFDHPSRSVLYDFYKIKSLSRFPTFLYIIQRL